MSVIKPSEVKPGMFVRVYQKVKESNKQRTQRIEGLVLSRKHGSEPGATITIRRIIKGTGVEWILPLFSPLIEKIELLKASKVRKAKLYYLREKSQKQARRKLKQTTFYKQQAKNEISEEKPVSAESNLEQKEKVKEEQQKETSAIKKEVKDKEESTT